MRLMQIAVPNPPTESDAGRGIRITRIRNPASNPWLSTLPSTAARTAPGRSRRPRRAGPLPGGRAPPGLAGRALTGLLVRPHRTTVDEPRAEPESSPGALAAGARAAVADARPARPGGRDEHEQRRRAPPAARITRTWSTASPYLWSRGQSATPRSYPCCQPRACPSSSPSARPDLYATHRERLHSASEHRCSRASGAPCGPSPAAGLLELRLGACGSRTWARRRGRAGCRRAACGTSGTSRTTAVGLIVCLRLLLDTQSWVRPARLPAPSADGVKLRSSSPSAPSPHGVRFRRPGRYSPYSETPQVAAGGHCSGCSDPRRFPSSARVALALHIPGCPLRDHRLDGCPRASRSGLAAGLPDVLDLDAQGAELARHGVLA